MASRYGNKAKSVFIGNLPQEVDEEALNELFGRAGPIISCRVAKDPDTQRYKGYAFCEYRDVETALSAYRNLNNVEFMGRQLRVDWDQGTGGDPMVNRAMAAPNVNRILGKERPVWAATKAPEAATAASPAAAEPEVQGEIIRAVYALPMPNLVHMVAAVQALVQEDPLGARALLSEDPALAFAVQAAAARLAAQQPVTPVQPDEVKSLGPAPKANFPLAAGLQGGLAGGLGMGAGLMGGRANLQAALAQMLQNKGKGGLR